LASIGRFFGERGAAPGSIGLGSVKSMIGHLKTAAGIPSLIKAAMALHTGCCRRHPLRTTAEGHGLDRVALLPADRTRLWEAGQSPRRAGETHSVLAASITTPCWRRRGGGGKRARADAPAGALPAGELFVLRARSRAELAARVGSCGHAGATPAEDIGKLALDEFARMPGRPVARASSAGRTQLASPPG